MSVAKRISAVAMAAAGVVGISSQSASAAPYLTLRLLGSTTGPGGPFSSSVNTAPGATIDFKIQMELGAEGSVNPFAGGLNGGFDTITNWIPSRNNPGSLPTAGLQTARFNIRQTVVAGQMTTDFGGADGESTSAFGNTGTQSWGGGSGAGNGGFPDSETFPNAPGFPTARAGGGRDLLDVKLVRGGTGNFDGISGTVVTVGQADTHGIELLDIVTGTFTVGGGSGSAVVNMDMIGVTGDAFAFRWRDVGNLENRNYTLTGAHQADSEAGGNPIIVFQGLNLVPEPATLGLLGLAGVGLLGRRRR